MKQFIERLSGRLLGTFSGFDRLRFGGTWMLLTSEGGLCEFLWKNGVLLKDFRAYVQTLAEPVRLAGERLAEHSEDFVRAAARRRLVTTRRSWNRASVR